MSYVYKNPEKLGYEKVRLTKSEIEELDIPSNWKIHQDFYKSKNAIVIHRYDSLAVKILNTILLPVIFSINAVKVMLKLIAEISEEYYRMIFAKKTGNFFVDRRYLDKKDREGIDKVLFRQGLKK